MVFALFSTTVVHADEAKSGENIHPLIQYDHYKIKVINRYPHNVGSFTQGLVYHDGFLLESTGLRRQSRLLKVELTTGKILKSHSLKDKYFGEGMTLLNGKIYQVTLDAKTCFIYDPNTFAQTGTFKYDTSGWGLTDNGKELILSDGTEMLRFIDPNTFEVSRKLEVFDNRKVVTEINELEFIDGLILANIWYSDKIIAIDQRSGKVVSTIDISSLTASQKLHDVSNGIAYDAKNNRLFVTGKRWDTLFEIALEPKVHAKKIGF